MKSVHNENNSMHKPDSFGDWLALFDLRDYKERLIDAGIESQVAFAGIESKAELLKFLQDEIGLDKGGHKFLFYSLYSSVTQSNEVESTKRSLEERTTELNDFKLAQSKLYDMSSDAYMREYLRTRYIRDFKEKMNDISESRGVSDESREAIVEIFKKATSENENIKTERDVRARFDQAIEDTIKQLGLDHKFAVMPIDKKKHYFGSSRDQPDAGIIYRELCKRRPSPVNTGLIMECKCIKTYKVNGGWGNDNYGQISHYLHRFVKDTQRNYVVGCLYSQHGIKFFMLEKGDNNNFLDPVIHTSDHYAWVSKYWVEYFYLLLKQFEPQCLNLERLKLALSLIESDVIAYIDRGCSSDVYVIWDDIDSNKKNNDNGNSNNNNNDSSNTNLDTDEKDIDMLKPVKAAKEVRKVLKLYVNNSNSSANKFTFECQNEAYILNQLHRIGFKHILPRNKCQYIYTESEKDAVALVLPYGKSVDLSNEKNKARPYLFAMVRELHAAGFYHGDLRWKNVLLFDGSYVFIDFATTGSPNNAEDKVLAQVTDFGALYNMFGVPFGAEQIEYIRKENYDALRAPIEKISDSTIVSVDQGRRRRA